jgi:hypothetical protein
LNGAFYPPSNIVPISKTPPLGVFFTGYVYLSTNASTIFSFTLPPMAESQSNDTCFLIFLLHGGRYALTGSGILLAYLLDEPVNRTVTYDTLHDRKSVGWSRQVLSGEESVDGFVLGGGKCANMVGERSYLIDAVGGLNVTGFITRGEPAVGAWNRRCGDGGE